MSGTRSHSRTAPATDGRWPVWKLAVMLYPFAAAAVAINLFLAGLIAVYAGFSGLSPMACVIAALPLGVPAAWASGRWARSLMDQAAD